MDSSVIWLKDIEGSEDIEKITKNIKERFGKEDEEWTILAMGKALEHLKIVLNDEELERQTERHSFLHSIEFLVNIFRRHCSKTPPFCRSIYGLTDQLLSLQLVMAQRNKQQSGQFKADLQDVVATHQEIMKSKLNRTQQCTSSDIQDIIDNYGKFLAHCNALDYADLISIVRECFKSDTSIKELYDKKHFIIYGQPVSLYEIEILSLLIGQRNILQFSSKNAGESISFEAMLDQSKSQSSSLAPCTPMNSKTKTNSCPITPQNLMSPILSQSPLSQGHVMMGQALSVFMSYLQLLVNSRDELALARVINMPCRELGIRQFNKIKQVAKDKNMTMFQMVMSFILQIRLGGKSYAPSSDNPLHFMTKGLGEFVSFFQKLQNIIEEIDNPKAAILKIIGTLQSTLIKSNNEALSSEDIRKASSFLKKHIDSITKDTTDLPVIENKSCMLGLKSYVLLCKILDKSILYDYQEKELYGVFKTPRRVQGKASSLLTKFRTPETPTPQKVVVVETKDKNSKGQRKSKMNSNNDIVPKRTSIWQVIVEDETEHNHRQPLAVMNTPTSRKRPLERPNHCGTMKDITCSPLRKRPCESMEDQENIVPSSSRGKKGTCIAKRGLLGQQKETEGTKKRNIKNVAQKKKSKPVKVLKGQQSLTCFFR